MNSREPERNDQQGQRDLGARRIPMAVVLWKAFLIWFPLALLFAGLMVRAHRQELAHHYEIMGQAEYSNLALTARNIQSEVRAVMLTLRSLAVYPTVINLLDTRDALPEYEAMVVLSALARAHLNVDQLRVINARGREVLRIDRRDGSVVVVEDDELQDKSNRYYFQHILALEPGRFYLSPLDLNVEHGMVEVPHNPMLRFGVPVDSPRGERLGVLVINYRAQSLLDSVVPQRSASAGPVDMLHVVGLLNRDGYWLKGFEPDSEWGGQLPERVERRFQAEFPDVWERLFSAPKAHVLADEGLYTMLQVHPLLRAPNTADRGGSVHGEGGREIGADSDSGMHGGIVDADTSDIWRLVSFVPIRAGERALHASKYFLPMTGVLVVLAFAAFLLALAYERRRDAQLRIQEQFRLLSMGEGKLRAVMESSHDALVVVDARGDIEYWNGAAEQMFGHTAREAVGRPVHDLLATDKDRNTARDSLQRFGDSGEGDGVGAVREFMALHKDGTIFPVERSLATFRYEGVWHAVGAVRNISERKEVERKLKELATTDGLTGLVNRRRLMELAEREMLRARRYSHPLSLLMFDVDHFKKINDTHGHDAGDKVLGRIADICRSMFRDVDVVSRVGGEEFVVLLPEVGLENATVVAERLREAMQTASVVCAGQVLAFTISVGVVELAVRSGEAATCGDATVADFLKRADVALYEAKRTGRNRMVAATCRAGSAEPDTER